MVFSGAGQLFHLLAGRPIDDPRNTLRFHRIARARPWLASDASRAHPMGHTCRRVLRTVRTRPILSAPLYFLFYIFPDWGVSMPALTIGVLGLGVFYSAYMTEIYRAGMESLPVTELVFNLGASGRGLLALAEL